MSLLKRAGAFALAFSMLVAVPGAAAPTNKQRARMAVHWLSHHQNEDGSFPGFSPIGSTADAVVSFVAAKRSPEDIDQAIAYLRANETEVDTIGEIAKVVMALVAAQENPRDFAGRDLISEITAAEQESGRYGEGTSVFDQALAVLALLAADESPSPEALSWLVRAQCPDGGWQFDDRYRKNRDNKHCFTGDAEADYFRSDTNTTSLAVQAVSQSAFVGYRYREDPMTFFRKIRDDVKGGWGYSWNARLTDTNSTALVIQAYVAAGRQLPDGAMRALTRLQYRLCGENAGAFAYSYDNQDGRYTKQAPDAGATIAAIPALLRKPFPIEGAAVSEPPPEPEPC